MPSVFRVEVPLVSKTWGVISRLFAGQLAHQGTHSDEDVRRMLLNQAAQLWVQMDEDVIQAGVVTEFIVYPRLTALNVWLTAAIKEARLDDAAFIETIGAFAIENGCSRIVTEGRPGWMRRFPTARFMGARLSMDIT
jgi:hypothetical protein